MPRIAAVEWRDHTLTLGSHGAPSIAINLVARFETNWRVFESIATFKNAFARGTSMNVNRMTVVIAELQEIVPLNIRQS